MGASVRGPFFLPVAGIVTDNVGGMWAGMSQEGGGLIVLLGY